MKTVLHVGKFYPPVAGGMERVLQTLCDATRGVVDNRVLVAHTDRRTIHEDVDGVHVTRVGTAAALGSVHVAPAFSHWLSRIPADLIILHEPNPWALLQMALRPPRVPLAIWYHSDVVRPRLQYAMFYAPMARRVYSRAERFIVSSPELGRHAAALRPYADRVRVIPFGINPSDWRRGGDGGFALFAGRHVPYKGVDILIRALAGTGIRTVIAGDGPMRAEWQRLAGRIGLAAQVDFAGEVSADRLKELMATCSLFVLPSITRAEAFGYVQLEAMASGKPVISTDVPSGVSWVNQHERTGLVVHAGDTEALRDALLRLMSDQRLREAFGSAARARVEDTFTMEHLRERLVDVYAECGLVQRAQRC